MAQYQQRTLGFRPALTERQGQAGTSAAERGYRSGSGQNANSSLQQRVWQTPNTNTGVQPGQSSGWRRMGQNPSPATQSPGISGNSGSGWQRSPANTPQSRVESRSNGNGYNRPASGDSGWRRFGAPDANSASRPVERAAPQPDSNNAGWHRFGYPGDRGSSAAPRSAPNQNRDAGSAGSSSFGQPRGYSRPYENYRSGAPMRMEQPIVHDRPSYSAPRAQQPRSEAPRAQPRYSAPRSNGAPSSVRHNDAPSGRGSRPSPSSNGGGGHQRRR